MPDFSDNKLTIPSISTLIYQGIDDKCGHMFGVIEGDNKTSCSIVFQDNDVRVLNKEHLIKWLQKEHSPQQIAESYDYVVSD